MKKLTTLLLGAAFIASAFTLSTQGTKIPAKVKTAFANHFKTATQVKWKAEKQYFEVTFELNDKDYSALFDANGTLLETEVEIAQDELPNGVLSYIQTHYPSQKIKAVEKITDSNQVTTYEIELKKTDVIFDATGTFIKELKD
jgi:hypothetical protein